MHTVQRTLVKSPPELWAELSDPGCLARHLDAFGEVRIVDLRPESRVAWESERAAGVIELAPAGWGTRVSLSAQASAVEDAPAPNPEPESESEPVPEPALDSEPEPQRAGFFARLRRLFGGPVEPPAPAPVSPEPEMTEPEPQPAPELEPQPQPEPAFDADDASSALERVLDTLGAAHHRPFSRG